MIRRKGEYLKSLTSFVIKQQCGSLPDPGGNFLSRICRETGINDSSLPPADLRRDARRRRRLPLRIPGILPEAASQWGIDTRH